MSATERSNGLGGPPRRAGRPGNGAEPGAGPGPDAAPPVRPAIMAEGFTFQPAGPDGPTPIRGLDFQVDPGGSLLVAGPTGSGKSLLLSCLAGLAHRHPDPRAAGRLAVVFEPGDEATRAALPVPRPGRVVLVPQQAGDGLLGLDVTTSLALPLEEAGRPPGETARRVADAVDRFGVTHLAERDVASLSGGERKRVALAGVEVVDPGLVLLDEPLSGLDPAGTRQVLDDLHRLRQRRTVVVAEHRTAHVRPLVDKVLHLLSPQPGQARALAPRLPPRDVVEAHVAAHGLTVHRGDRLLFQNLDLDWGSGVVGVTGPNGAGKSTLLHTLAGLVRPRAGDVRIGTYPVWQRGRPARGWRRRERALRHHLSLAAQDPRDAFFAGSVVDELAEPLRSLRIAHPRRAARAAGLAALRHAQLHMLAERAPSRLSGGEGRLVQVLGALAVGPHVLFLDEPTHGLDPDARAALASTIEGFAAAGGLVVVATHEPELLPPDTRWVHLTGDGAVLQGDDADPDSVGSRAHAYREAMVR